MNSQYQKVDQDKISLEKEIEIIQQQKQKAEENILEFEQEIDDQKQKIKNIEHIKILLETELQDEKKQKMNEQQMRIQKEQELQSEQITRKQAEEKIQYLEKDVLEQQQKIQKLEQQQKDNEQQIKQEQQKKDKAENRIIKLEKENKIEHWKLNNMEDRAQIAEKTMKIVNEENMKLTQILYPPRNDQEEQYKIEQEKRRLSFIESIQDRFLKYSKQAYDKVNHYTEILKDYTETIKGKILGKDQIPWDQIANELLYGEQRDQNEWQTIVERKEWYCRTIISTMNEQDQEQKIEAMINSSVVNSLYNIFVTQDNDTFSQSCADAFIQLSKYGQVQSKLDIDTHSRISDIIANLYSRNLRVIKQSLNYIFLIIRHEVQITPSTEPYSHFLDFEKQGAIDQFYKVFQDNDNSDIKNMASLCIGQLYRARRFEDDDMKEQIINYLTALSQIEDDNSVVQKSAMQTLKNLLPYQCMLIFVKKFILFFKYSNFGNCFVNNKYFHLLQYYQLSGEQSFDHE